MTSKIKVDNINKVSDDSNIINKCGTTITLGASGDTINLASGASQSGFGRTGTVDWQTASIKTATFTAVNGEGYFANTSGGAFNMNLPAGVAGHIVSVVDYTNSFQTHKLTLVPNGTDKIGGTNANSDLSAEGQSVTLVYVDGLEGWKAVQDSTTVVEGGSFISATVSGSCNTLTCCGNYKFATFKNPGTFCVSAGSGGKAVADYLVVAGGGGGGSEFNSSTAGAGAGGGGFRWSNDSPDWCAAGSPGNPLAGTQLNITPGPYSIVVGGGGAFSPGPGVAGDCGGVSTFGPVTSAGGGGGGNTVGPPAERNGQDGGSGGGGAPSHCGGAGNTPPTSPPQGNNGGSNASPGPVANYYLGGAGGGATAVGGCGGPSAGGTGGAGAGIPAGVFGTLSGQPCGSYRYYSGGGGGGGSSNTPKTGPAGPGGLGGGAAGGAGGACAPAAATALTGGGGGGAGNYGPGSPTTRYGSNGGSGIVIIRYKYQ